MHCWKCILKRQMVTSSYFYHSKFFFLLTKKLWQPSGLVVVLDGDGARVEEDEDNDEPEPPLLLAHPTNADPGTTLLRPELAPGTFKQNHNHFSYLLFTSNIELRVICYCFQRVIKTFFMGIRIAMRKNGAWNWMWQRSFNDNKAAVEAWGED